MRAGSAKGDKVAIRTALRQALALYRRLSRRLADIVARLEAAAEPGALLGADDLAALKLHQNALMTVLSFELQLFKRDGGRPGGGAAGSGESLDLDAARTEVAGRLRRLSE